MAFPIIRRLKNPSESEINRVVIVLQNAFGEDDPFTKFLVGGDMSLVPLELGANVRAAAIGGEIHVAAVGPETDDIVGAAIWYAPGQETMSTDEQRAAGWDTFLATIPEDLKKWWVDYFIPTMGQFAEETLGPRYKLNSWHLHLFGVIPEHQRKGLGKLLIRTVDDLAKTEGIPIVLETTTEVDVLIYKRMGFKVIGETYITSPFGRSPMHLMTKEPQTG